MVEKYPNRRQVLKSVGGTGAVLGSNYLITGNVIAEDSHDRKRRQLGEVFKSTEDRQKKHQGGGNVETEKKYYTIPRSQWIRVETAQKACKRLSREMLELEPSGLVTVSVVSEYSRPKSEKRLNVEYTRIKRKLRDGSEETIAEPSVDYEEVETESPYTVSGGVEDQEGQAERKLEVSVTEQTLYE
jgi:hypothetical protein